MCTAKDQFPFSPKEALSGPISSEAARHVENLHKDDLFGLAESPSHPTSKVFLRWSC